MYPIKTRSKYDPDNLAASANTYTTVYLGNYVAGSYDEDVGSHCGVDIVPIAPHDAVVSVLPWVVQVSAVSGADGEYIVVRHDGVPDPDDFSKTITLYSCYLHLSARSVSAGDKVAEGAVIGATGNTGNSTGEHLHFQIDRANAPFHAYWPFTFADAHEAGLGFFEAVNRGLWIDNARKFTINPLVYLDKVEQNGGVKNTASTVVTPVVHKEETHIAANTTHTSTLVSSFSDVPADYPYKNAIEYVRAQGIASGSNGKFRPDAAISRAELAKMAIVASGKPISTDVVPHYSDIELGSAFLPYINTARELGAISGYDDGTFHPDSPVTRAEALKIVLSVLGTSLGVTSQNAYTDVKISDWVAKYASWAKTHTVFSADPDTGALHPDFAMERGEVANLIYKAKNA